MMDIMSWQSCRPDDDHSMLDNVAVVKHPMAFNMNMMMMGPTSTSTSTSTSKSSHWKLYDNPFYCPNNPSPSLKHKHLVRKYSASFKHFHRHSPLDLEVEMEVDQARTQIAELKTELELERKLRKKAEKKVLEQEMKMRDDVCRLKAEIDTMKKEMEKERNMLRLAEVFREERLQMKLADAHHLYHQSHHQHPVVVDHQSGLSNITNLMKSSTPSTSTDTIRSVQRRASPEPENPHIKRGIKGFVEFPRAFKARKQLVGITTSNYHNKVECQKAQLEILLKTKSPLISHSHPLLRA